jgi:membrane protein insertase Oxa1/YidC/SpoIIIJ
VYVCSFDISQGGFGWITDLSVADPFLITPVLSAATMLLMIEVLLHSMALVPSLT